MAQQARNAGADEGTELTVLIKPSTRRNREPARHVEVILYKHARDRERIGKTRKINWLKIVAFDRHAAHQCVPADCAPDRHFGKPGVVVIPLSDLSVLM